MPKISVKIFLIILGAFLTVASLTVKAATPTSFIYLTWESDAMAPMTYGGKSLVVKDSLLKMTVHPFAYSAGSYLDPSVLNYRWSVNDEVKKEGRGITIFRFLVPSVLEDYNQIVKVEVFRGLTSLGEKTEIIPVLDPKVILRPVDNSLRIKGGVLELGNSGNTQIQAHPYFFSPTAQNQLQVSWWLNNEKQKADSSNNYIFTVSNSKPQNALNQITALIERLDNVFVRGNGQLQVKFIGL